MELSNFKIAEKLQLEISELKEQLEHIDEGAWRLGVELVLKTGYSDMGRDYTTKAAFKEDITSEICQAVKEVVSRRIEALEKEFKEL